ncbi:type IV-A pilus assembly ATPase PilB [Desulfohalobium retbaense]|uniref:Type IV-A pilus assembly ATPase PilB n=1 Tax=Desulfohalobium retbaense (strain ATCC 49708 / DSM 5692 / JCM 16813 / HR100) TaxID=485915 RepID=C8X268_DESRD|nr:type IV-A pilus assembly ATPase PilB [Desulfohalobium retbaense]ACV68391.1 type IV-A pilus assembly ATPase PilB [Desulfohalobium retbaense DSM 5692]
MAKQTTTEALKQWAQFTAEEIRDIEELQRQKRTSFLAAAFDKDILRDQDYLEFLSQRLSMPCAAPELFDIAQDIFELVPSELCRKYEAVPFFRHNNTLFIATADPENLLALDDIRFVTGMELAVHIATPTSIAVSLENYLKGEESGGNFGDLDEALADIAESDVEISRKSEESASEEPSVLEAASQAPVVKMVNLIIMDAIRKKASDIHIEPYEELFRVRFRIDGVLQEVMRPPMRLRNAIISRLKIMSHMDIAERRLPQDGRVKVRTPGGLEVEFRVSVLPLLYGEKVVMRLLDKSSLNLDLRDLGLEDSALEILQRAIIKPYGMILVTGPTGSGKTTTLYSAIMELNKQEVNIATAEDPVEYSLEGVNQVQVRDDIGLTFAGALRSFLRQDPDIILVGEIRDLETAEIAVKAAMTGHLVLSTLHTNDAPRTLTRLMNMGVEEYLIASSVNAIVAQRLVRKLCPFCKQDTELSQPVLDALGIDPATWDDSQVCAPRGCPKCNNTGYKGRIGLYEVLEVTETMQELILQRASVPHIHALAIEEGMLTMRQSGIEKIRQGITSAQEVLKVTA